ncbi:MAG: hypothetical protein Q7J24_16945 [Desulfomicrobium sp.]|nr:hypothetical protein [Desulfomicrobium sp.]
MIQSWRKVPENPEYELSKTGRLRGPDGASCMPDVSNRPVAAARYAVPVGRGRRVYLLVRDGMAKIWKVKFEPTVAWVREVRAEVMAAMEARRAAKRAAKASANARRKRAAENVNREDESVAGSPEFVSVLPDVVSENSESVNAVALEKRKTGLAPVDLSAPEEWRVLPGHPRYMLSNQGRLRSARGLMSPNVNGSSAATSKYQLWDPRTRTQTSLTIRLGMAEVWEIAFVPTSAWVKQIREEVLAEVASKRALKAEAPQAPQMPADEPEAEIPAHEPEAEKSKPRSDSGSSRPGRDTMNCPWATPGMLDKAGLPPGVETWDCGEMDPMTHRGENGVWVDVPARKRKRRAKQQAQEAA